MNRVFSWAWVPTLTVFVLTEAAGVQAQPTKDNDGAPKSVTTASVVGAVADEGNKSLAEAEKILERYLESPHPSAPPESDRARQARLAILAELTAMPEEALSVAEKALFGQADPKQRHEIVGALGGHIHTRDCADLLYRVIQDVREPEDREAAHYEELVRCSAVHGLRKMASRTHRSGGKRIQRTPDSEPKVQGLVPYLVFAANDKAERVRVSALYALADTRDPAAVAELRNRLKDESEKVRLYAACFLTEYQDASGLPEMRNALRRFKGRGPDSPEEEFSYYAKLESLFASFERITGRSFGEIPDDPGLCSSLEMMAEQKRQFVYLLDAWSQWWDWQPDSSGNE